MSAISFISLQRSRTNGQVTKTEARTQRWAMEKKATVSFTVVIGVFVLCWGPSTLYYFIMNSSPEIYEGSFQRYESVFSSTMKILTFCNSFMNPLIYFWFNADFRLAFMRVLKREWQTHSRSCTTNSMTLVARCSRPNGNRV